MKTSKKQLKLQLNNGQSVFHLIWIGFKMNT